MSTLRPLLQRVRRRLTAPFLTSRSCWLKFSSALSPDFCSPTTVPKMAPAILGLFGYSWRSRPRLHLLDCWRCGATSEYTKPEGKSRKDYTSKVASDRLAVGAVQ